MSSELATGTNVALESMNPELRKEFSAIANYIKEQIQLNLQFYHKLGTKVAKVHADEAKYGSGAVDKIATGIALDKGIVYKAMTFAKQFTADELKGLMARETANGKPLTWSHMAQLVHVPERQKVDELIELIFTNDLSVRDLRDVLKQREGALRNRIVTPKTAIGGLTQTDNMVGRLAEKFSKQFDKVVLKPLGKVNEDNVTPEMITKVQATTKVLRTLAESATQRANQLEALEGQLTQASEVAVERAAEAAKAEAAKEKADKAKTAKGAAKNGVARRERRPVSA